MPNIKAVLKEKRHTKISSCSLKAEGGKKRWLNPLFCLGLERGGQKGENDTILWNNAICLTDHPGKSHSSSHTKQI